MMTSINQIRLTRLVVCICLPFVMAGFLGLACTFTSETLQGRFHSGSLLMLIFSGACLFLLVAKLKKRPPKRTSTTQNPQRG